MPSATGGEGSRDHLQACFPNELRQCYRLTISSHVYCNGCAESLGLTGPAGLLRHCPACQHNLPNPDDAVLTRLNPTEDYKTSVLSGLNPNIIMECAGRGLAFWSYQCRQEMYAL